MPIFHLITKGRESNLNRYRFLIEFVPIVSRFPNLQFCLESKDTFIRFFTRGNLLFILHSYIPHNHSKLGETRSQKE